MEISVFFDDTFSGPLSYLRSQLEVSCAVNNYRIVRLNGKANVVVTNSPEKAIGVAQSGRIAILLTEEDYVESYLKRYYPQLIKKIFIIYREKLAIELIEEDFLGILARIWFSFHCRNL